VLIDAGDVGRPPVPPEVRSFYNLERMWGFGDEGLRRQPTGLDSLRARGGLEPSMLLHVIARGKIGRSPEAELVERYARRIAWRIEADRAAREPAGRIPEPQTPFRTILLDERGRTPQSEELGRTAAAAGRDNGIRETRFLIGAADGPLRADRDGADRLLAFGNATWPHLMPARCCLSSLFRATSMLAGHPYHRAG
jgi:23S rRNA (pseudouridine1915-N3)-methyltransferase